MNRLLTTLALIFALVNVAGCKSDECVVDADCPDGRSCRLGLCAPSVSEGDAGAANDIVLGCRAAEAGDLLLVEVLADPGGVDVNADGFYDSSDDEFVEFVNLASVPVGLLNVQLRVSGSGVDLDAVCLEPYAAHVHFGATDRLGLNNTGDVVDLLISGEIVDTLTYGGEGGDQQSLTRLEQLNSDSPWVQHLEVSTETWSPGVCANGAGFPNCESVSAGVDASVQDVADGADATWLPDTAAPCDAPTPTPGQLLIHEILADPAVNFIDANQDGYGDNKDDEFVEIVNVSGGTLALDGVTLTVTSTTSTSAGSFFTAPVGTCLGAGQAAVIFAAYVSGGDFGGALAFEQPDLGLNNNGDTVTLGVNGVELDSVTYTKTEGDADQSMTRQVDLDITAPMVRHSEALGAGTACPPALTQAHQPTVPGEAPRYELQCGTVATPGRCNSGAPFPDCVLEVGPDADADVVHGDAADGSTEALDSAGAQMDAAPPCGESPAVGELRINEIMSDPAGVDHNASGSYAPTEDEYVEIVNVTQAPLDLSDVWVTSNAGEFQPLDGCLPAQSGILIFGGGQTTLASTEKVIVIQNTALGMGNDGGTVALVARSEDADDVELDSVDYTPSSGISWTRDPDGTGPFVLHNEHSEVQGLQPDTMQEGFSPNYSPGLCADWSPFGSCL
ncbi:MAG: lamin tail domain-containing protein [Myxococcota bacterium]